MRIGSSAVLSITWGADQIRVWSAQSDGELLLDTVQPVKSWQGQNLPSTLWIEAAAPSQSAGDITLVLSFHANPFVTTPATDTVKLTAFQTDLAIDSNNNGIITEADDLIEDNADKPGRLILANNDDDDANGIADYLDSGTVQGEDDLVAMDLNILGLISGTATLSIESGVDKVLVWLNPQKDGLGPIMGGSVTEMTWDLGQQPGTVYVEAIVGSLVAGDISFLLAAAPPVGTPATDQVKATARGVELIFREQNLGRDGNAGDVIVGERIKIVARLLGPGDDSTFNWAVPEIKIADWDTQAGENQQNAKVIPLTRTQESDVQFHWVDGADKRTVTVTGIHGGQEFLGRATFRVLRPTAGFISSKQHTIVSNLWDPAQGLDALHVGNGNHTKPNTAGVYFKATVPAEQFPGNLQWIQTVEGYRRELRNVDNSWYRATYKGLDGAYPYEAGNEMGDSPGATLFQENFSQKEIDDKFIAWAMYRPPNSPDGESEWVPLLKVLWAWGGKAQWDGQMWNLIEGSANHPDPQKMDTTDYPQWDEIVTQLEFIKENP